MLLRGFHIGVVPFGWLFVREKVFVYIFMIFHNTELVVQKRQFRYLTTVRQHHIFSKPLSQFFMWLQFCLQTCDHPYVADVCLKPLLTKNLEVQKILDVEVKASGKLHLLDAMLTQIKKNGLKAVVFYQVHFHYA